MEVTAENFDEEVTEVDEPVFTLFWASWCTACKRSEQTVREIEEERDDIKVVEVNIDKNPSMRDRFDIQGVPTFIMFNGGEEVDRKISAQAKKQLNEMIDEALER
ncbi:MAG: thioredoxin family protein [Candidatus Natronoplasma sp.]